MVHALVSCCFHCEYIWYVPPTLAKLISLVSPTIYSFHLFEVILLFATLQNVLRAIIINPKTLSGAALLMCIVIFFFSNIYMGYLYEDMLLVTGNSPENMCPYALKCFTSVMSYGLRCDAFWENLIPSSRMLLQLLYFNFQ